jgi:hypothetical protein
MRQMTLRDIPEDIEKIARQEARVQGVSLNKAFLRLLRQGSRQVSRQQLSATTVSESRFSRFCGVWTDQDAADFDNALADQRGIDDEMWQ